MTTPDGISAILKAAAGHPLRWKVLGQLRRSDVPLSPNLLRHALGASLDQMIYHVAILRDHRLIERVLLNGQVTTRRGAIEHFYRITAEGRELVDAADALAEAIGARNA